MVVEGGPESSGIKVQVKYTDAIFGQGEGDDCDFNIVVYSRPRSSWLALHPIIKSGNHPATLY